MEINNTKMKITLTTFLRKTLQCFKLMHSSLTCFYISSRNLLYSFFRAILLHVDPFWLQLCYFVTLFMFGYFFLAILEPRYANHRPRNYDLLFTSVSAVTVSSISTVEMEVFSNTQLFCLAILILFGGEVFTSMLELQLNKFKLLEKESKMSSATFDHSLNVELEDGLSYSMGNKDLKYKTMKSLGFVILFYFLTMHLTGFLLVSLYVGLDRSANNVLSNKNLNIQVFSIFTTISSFANCGFLPTNEGMMVFKKNLGLLVILVPLVLLGNTLYPIFLRLLLLLLRMISKRDELGYALEHEVDLRYHHMLSRVHCLYLALTSFGFIFIQFLLFISIGWKSSSMEGLNSLEKVIGSLFQAINTRHSGESVFDLSLISPAIIVLIITMMYLPAYTYFIPREYEHIVSEVDKNPIAVKKKASIGFFLLSPLPFLVIIVMLICITESENMQKDPLNFSFLNIIFEVISAYGNVGYSLGYSCKKQLQPDGNCRDASFGFAGRWSIIGKLILIVVMVFGRLRKFHKRGGIAWKLSQH